VTRKVVGVFVRFRRFSHHWAEILFNILPPNDIKHAMEQQIRAERDRRPRCCGRMESAEKPNRYEPRVPPRLFSEAEGDRVDVVVGESRAVRHRRSRLAPRQLHCGHSISLAVERILLVGRIFVRRSVFGKSDALWPKPIVWSIRRPWFLLQDSFTGIKQLIKMNAYVQPTFERPHQFDS
jgi:hypothetical protein